MGFEGMESILEKREGFNIYYVKGFNKSTRKVEFTTDYWKAKRFASIGWSSNFLNKYNLDKRWVIVPL